MHLLSLEKHLPLERRWQSVIETPDGISYVHHEASHSISHRDIRLSNILLDDTFNLKVTDADFSISAPFFLWQRSNQFAEKYDAYIFGVVLVELLSGIKPSLSGQGNMYTLYDHFLSAINSGHLNEILNLRVMDAEDQVQMENVTNLAKVCLYEEGRARPSMREVVKELAWIRATSKHAGGWFHTGNT
ncbi:hypothetical protein SUGI_0460260 [Cryptomeria japonica]|nr:hypothetical protein SUGI_0460260 [Cryptomeria japonica]